MKMIVSTLLIVLSSNLIAACSSIGPKLQIDSTGTMRGPTIHALRGHISDDPKIAKQQYDNALRDAESAEERALIRLYFDGFGCYFDNQDHFVQCFPKDPTLYEPYSSAASALRIPASEQKLPNLAMIFQCALDYFDKGNESEYDRCVQFERNQLLH